MNYDFSNIGASLANRRKQTNPKQLASSSKNEMTVDESELGSYFQITPRHSLETTAASFPPPPLLKTVQPNETDGSIMAFLQQSRNSWPFSLFTGAHFNLPSSSGPPPLAKIAVSASSTPSPIIDQPINLTAGEVKRRASSQLTNVSTPPIAGTPDGGDPLDLSAKPPSLTRVLSDVPPKAHSCNDFKFCRLCSRETNVNESGLCSICQIPAAMGLTSPPINPLAASLQSLFPGLLPSMLPGLPLELAQVMAARSIAKNDPPVERRKCDSSGDKCISPSSSCGSDKKPAAKSKGVKLTSEAPSSSTSSTQPTQFFCEKCNISFRTAKSLEAHLVDYCQQTGHVSGAKRGGSKRKPIDGANTANGGQDLVCQLCGYHGHSERGIRVHFNAMHSIGSEIQLEQYLTTMIVRADPDQNLTGKLDSVTSATPTSKRRRLNQNNNANKLQQLQFHPFHQLLELPGLKPVVQTPVSSIAPVSLSTSPSSTKDVKLGELAKESTIILASLPTPVPAVIPPPGSNTSSSSTTNSQSSNSLRRQPPFECRLCTKTFPDTAKLRLHMRSHEKDESILYSCKRCNNFKTAIKSDLVRHVKAEHEGCNMRLSTWTIPRQASSSVSVKTDDCMSKPAPNEGTSMNDDGPIWCEVCQISFKFKRSYDAHRQYYCMAKWNEAESDHQTSSPASTTKQDLNDEVNSDEGNLQIDDDIEENFADPVRKLADSSADRGDEIDENSCSLDVTS